MLFTNGVFIVLTTDRSNKKLIIELVQVAQELKYLVLR